jgi:hypothetical protein
MYASVCEPLRVCERRCVTYFPRTYFAGGGASSSSCCGCVSDCSTGRGAVTAAASSDLYVWVRSTVSATEVLWVICVKFGCS